MPSKQSTVLDARAVDRALRRMADEIVELNAGTDDLIIVGIQRRGVQLAARIVSNISDREKAKVPLGALDITLYRDDLQRWDRVPSLVQRTFPRTSTAEPSSLSTTCCTLAARSAPRSTSWPTLAGRSVSRWPC